MAMVAIYMPSTFNGHRQLSARQTPRAQGSAASGCGPRGHRRSPRRLAPPTPEGGSSCSFPVAERCAVTHKNGTSWHAITLDEWLGWVQFYRRTTICIIQSVPVRRLSPVSCHRHPAGLNSQSIEEPPTCKSAPKLRDADLTRGDADRSPQQAADELEQMLPTVGALLEYTFYVSVESLSL